MSPHGHDRPHTRRHPRRHVRRAAGHRRARRAAGGSVSTLVFLVLLAAGVLTNAERLVAVAGTWVQSRQAHQRLASIGCDGTRRHDSTPTLQATYAHHALKVSGYLLPDTDTGVPPDRIHHQHRPNPHRDGSSGTGKTTLFTAIASTLQKHPAPGVVTAVQADDYLFTGTVAGNIRLANSAATDADIKQLLVDIALDHIDPQPPVGVRGLSGGEQRRLHIARA